MKAVYKYELPSQALGLYPSSFEMRVCDGEFLHLDKQNGKVCVWILVEDTDAPEIKQELLVLGTGMPVPEYFIHLATWKSDDAGSYVWHLFGKDVQ